MTEDMIKNINLVGNIQYFSDTTYYCIPPQCKSLKMWVLLSYNTDYNKTLICNISLIKNENYETFRMVLNYLKDNYNFKPNIMTTDFCKASYKALKSIYENIRIVPCFFHLIQNLNLHLPQLKSKTKSIKNNAKNLIVNMKLLCFVDEIKIDELFNKIKEKYDNSFHDFLEYFNKTYILHEPYNDKSWNYASFYKKFSDNNLFFFTNNICESTNRIFNMHFIYNRKSFYSFKKCLLETLEYFKNKEEYEEKGIQLTRALHNYVTKNYNHDRLPLISSKDIKNMLEEYKK